MKLLFSPFNLRVCNCFCGASRAEAKDDLTLKDRVVGGLEYPAGLPDGVSEQEIHIFGFKLSELRSGKRSESVFHRKRVFNRTHKAEGPGLNHNITLAAQRNTLTGDELIFTSDVFGTIHSIRPPHLKGFKL
jgi:hypothetical protein